MEEALEYLSRLANEIGSVQPGTAAVTLAIGILNCFFGYRLMKAWIGLAGFVLGAGLAYSLASHYTRSSLVQMGAILAVGLALGLSAFYIYRMGVFLLCTGIGATAASVALQPRDSLMFMLCLGVGILLGLLGMAFVKPMVILNTAFGGGFSIAGALAWMLKKQGDMRILVLGTALFLAGVAAQTLFAGTLSPGTMSNGVSSNRASSNRASAKNPDGSK